MTIHTNDASQAHISDEDDFRPTEAVQMRLDGTSVPDIARHFGVDRSLIYSWTNKLRPESGFPNNRTGPQKRCTGVSNMTCKCFSCPCSVNAILDNNLYID